jgi:hypothetical protein
VIYVGKIPLVVMSNDTVVVVDVVVQCAGETNIVNNNRMSKLINTDEAGT